jgi:uncharacterized protein DUF3605
MPHQELSFWNFNIPVAERTATCPDFLVNACEKDKLNLSQWDVDFEDVSWEEARQLIESNNLHCLRRPPGMLRKYREFVHKVKRQYGSVQNFVIYELLNWPNPVPKGAAFEHPEDIKITYNDWPYGFEPSITHLVLWTKFSLPVELSKEDNHAISNFVSQVFENRVGKDNVLWWKNPPSLKSVRAVEHFHVLLRNADDASLQQLTGSARPSVFPRFRGTFAKETEAAEGCF